LGAAVIIGGACGGGSTAEPGSIPNAAALPQRPPPIEAQALADQPLSTPGLPESQPAATATAPASPVPTASPGPGRAPSTPLPDEPPNTPSRTPKLPDTRPAAATPAPAAPVSTAAVAPDPVPAPLSDRPAGQTALTVTFRDGEFDPKRIEIEAGRAVRFVNESEGPVWPASNIHPTHQIYTEFDSKAPVPPGGTWELAFERAGFWRYHNHLDPSHSGLVVVTRDEGQAAVVPLVLGSDVPTFETLGAVSPGDAIDLFRDDTLLGRYLEVYGPAVVVSLLSEYQSRISTDCHQRAHEAGRIAYDLFGALAFSLAGHECHAGAYHGATEALFRDRGTANLHADVGVLCGSSPNSFFRHQCVHGVGHGLMAWTSYELLDTLELCDRLEDRTNQRSCYSGAFMENIVGGLAGTMGHYTEFVSDDPHFPCNILGETYLPSCYFYQSTRMVQLFGGDFAKVAAACAEAPRGSHYVCFQSMGRDVGGATRGNPARAIELCSNAQESTNRLDCLSGAVQDSFWDAGGADDALEFCALLEQDKAKTRCYATIIPRAHQIYQDPADTAYDGSSLCRHSETCPRGLGSDRS